jgi:hypothetical protein
MNAIIYLPQQQPHHLLIDERLNNGLASLPAWVPELLGCEPGLVDVLASGPGYVAYSVFDYEAGPVNMEAMRELTDLTGVTFEPDDGDAVLLGPVLVIHW